MAGTYTKLYYHIVFSTKNRSRYITDAIEDELHKYVSGIIRGLGGRTDVAAARLADVLIAFRGLSPTAKRCRRCAAESM